MRALPPKEVIPIKDVFQRSWFATMLTRHWLCKLTRVGKRSYKERRGYFKKSKSYQIAVNLLAVFVIHSILLLSCYHFHGNLTFLSTYGFTAQLVVNGNSYERVGVEITVKPELFQAFIQFVHYLPILPRKKNLKCWWLAAWNDSEYLNSCWGQYVMGQL